MTYRISRSRRLGTPGRVCCLPVLAKIQVTWSGGAGKKEHEDAGDDIGRE
jgi:hypothetical protein